MASKNMFNNVPEKVIKSKGRKSTPEVVETKPITPAENIPNVVEDVNESTIEGITEEQAAKLNKFLQCLENHPEVLVSVLDAFESLGLELSEDMRASFKLAQAQLEQSARQENINSQLNVEEEMKTNEQVNQKNEITADGSATNSVETKARAAKETIETAGCSGWIPSVVAAGAAIVTAGYDMVLNGDLSTARIVGGLGAGVVAVGAQQLIQRTVTNEQSTTVNSAIGAVVGGAIGFGARFGIDYYNSATADNSPVEEI